MLLRSPAPPPLARALRASLRLALASLLLTAPAGASGSDAPAPQDIAPPTWSLLTWDAPITPAAADYLVGGIEDAAALGRQGVVILLDTPGGLDTSMRDIIKAQLASPAPVAVYVGPSGARAASAGAFMTVAAGLAAMAPGTNIGSASPVQMGGAIADSTLAHKVANDAAAYMVALANQRGRNADVARSFVTEAVNLTAAEAVAAGVVDLMAADLAALADSLRGRAIDTAAGPVTLSDAAPVFVAQPPSARQKLLKILSDPNLAYILMMLGIYGLFFELSNPGSVVPGVLGGICLLLALFAFQAMPIDASGAALMLLGVVLLILEVKVASYGLLSIGGLAALALGSVLLIDSPEPWARISWQVLAPTLAVFGAFSLLCIWLVVRSRRRPVVTGRGALLGGCGRVLVAPGETDARPGKVVVHGEIWDAVAAVPLTVESRIRVTAVRGRILDVEPAEPGAAQPRS